MEISGDVANKLPPPLVQKEPVDLTVGMDSMFDKVLKSLAEDEVRIMGLYGQGGVGKTTLLKQINNEFLKSSTTHGFDVVIFVVVSKEINIDVIHKEIGRRLGLSSPDRTSIFNTLSKKNFLLLLDDIWGRFDLQSVGVPRPENNNKSKVIFTTRSETVCGHMDANKKFRVECLSPNVAWTLFQEKVGSETVNSFPRARYLAKVVAGKCGGLPLALITIGRVMSNKKTLQEWNHAVTTLQRDASNFPGMGDEVLPCLKLSYDYLRDDTIKSCFLYCALFPEDRSIDKQKLVDYWIGEGLILLNEFDNIDEARNYGYDIIGNLKGACLLESGTYEQTQVKMHDTIRDLALWIAHDYGRKRNKICIMSKKSDLLKNTSTSAERSLWYINAERICLYRFDFEEKEEVLPQLKSPNLLTFITPYSYLYCLPQNYFQFTPLLRVLDLSSNNLMKTIPISITGLVELQYLNLSKTHIQVLPEELRRLVKLKYLDLSHMLYLTRIPSGVIGSLLELRVLNLYESYGVNWDVKEMYNLKHLNDLRIFITTDYNLNNLLSNQYLQICTRLLRLTTIKSNLETHSFQNLNEIQINKCNELKDLTWISYVGNLEKLQVWNCSKIEEIIGGDGSVDIFKSLKVLFLGDLPKLKSICRNALAFPCLEALVVKECPQLKKLPFDSGSNVNNTLREIVGGRKWWNELQWEEDHHKKELVKSKFFPYFSRKDYHHDDDNDDDLNAALGQLKGQDETIESKFLPYHIRQKAGEVSVRTESVEIIAAEVDKNLQKDDDQHEPSITEEVVVVRPQSINIIAAEVDNNLQEVAIRPESVEIIAAEVDNNLQKDDQQLNRGRCLGGLFPTNCWSNSYKKKLGKLVAKKKMSKVVMKQQNMFERAWSLLGEDADDEIRIMGLYGQGGVGKTTLLKQINNEFIKSRGRRGLDVVILLVVSKQINVEAIQRKIGERLKLPLQGDERRRAEEIFNVLRNKNFVLLLDDIWERVDLQCIGVPHPQGKSKVIFTTRSKIVCGLMEADKTFKVECLPWDKAWSLFKEKVGEEALNSHPKVPEFAEVLAKECDGLPLALTTIGRAMSTKKTLQEWNHAITPLWKSSSELLLMGDDAVLRLLKLCYDSLSNDTVKSCFLYCALYPEHHSIPKSQLIDFWVGEGIFQWVNDIDEVRNRAYDVIESLQGVCLLESCEDEETSVKMHDVIRDLALWIDNEFGRTMGKILVERATGTPNTSEKWENAERIYLSVDLDTKEEEEEIQNVIQMETPPRSPNLLTLMMHGHSYYADLFLPQNFFQLMPLLRVLDFSELEMEEFPISITELVELQYLGLAKTNIEALPDELRKLVKLKYLDLSHTYFLRKIPPGVITSLSELRVFNQYHSDFGDWEEDGPSLRELVSLRHLDDLGITVETVLALQRLLRNRKLRMCTRRLTINECINLKSLALLSTSPSLTTTTLSLGNLKRLKELTCQNCSALEELTMNWAMIEDEKKGLLSNLETLTLWNLPKLNVVWEKQYVCSSFQNLKEISIIGCNALKDLTWLVYVRNLETLYLLKCQQVEKILDVDGFGGGGDEMLTGDVVFERLKNIYLGNLLRLESICKHALAFPSLKSMVVEDCPHLKKLPLDCDSNVNNTLQRIEGGATWWNQLYWKDDHVKSKFLPYYDDLQ